MSLPQVPGINTRGTPGEPRIWLVGEGPARAVAGPIHGRLSPPQAHCSLDALHGLRSWPATGPGALGLVCGGRSLLGLLLLLGLGLASKVQSQLLEEGLNGLRAHPGAPRSGDGTEGAPLEAPITAEVPRMCGERARGRDLAHRHECKPAFYVSRNPEEEINRTTRVKILADERLGCC